MAYEIEELCTNAKELLKKELTSISYETWIKNFEVQKMTNDTITLIVPTTFHKDFLKSRYYDLIFNTFKYLTNKEYKIEINSLDSIEENNEKETKKEENITQNNINNVSNFSLNSKYTFETFVVGNNNRFAHAASLAVAEAPGAAYNPLFLYGGVGLRKNTLNACYR